MMAVPMNKKVISILLTVSLLFANLLISKAPEVNAENHADAIIQSLSGSAGSKNIFAKSKVQPQVAAGFGFSVLLKDDATVWTCGVDNLAQCGNSGAYYGNGYSKLKQVNGLSDVVAVDCADSYTLALKSDGTVWGWGWNDYNGLGAGKPQVCIYASRITGISDVTAIAAGNHMSIFVKKDGTLWYTCKQNGKAGKLKTFQNMKDIISVKTAHQCAIALTKGGEVWTWEWEYKDDGYKIATPVKQKLKNIKSIEAGEFHYMALDKDGALWLWGMNNSGEIGDGTHEWCYSPKKILKNVKMMTGGGYYSMAELKDGTVYAWGDNECGQFGNNTTKSATKPVKVSGLKDVISMDAGMYHTLAIRGNGEVVIMGNNYGGLLGLGDKKEHITPALLTDLSKKVKPTDNPNQIYPNGDISDWGDVKPIVKGSAPENEKLVGIKALYARIEDHNLYLAASITSGLPAYVNFGLDTNGDNKADYKISFTDENFAVVHQYKKSGDTFIKMEDNYGAYGSVIEIIVNFSYLDNPDRIAVIATYGADKEKYGVNSEIKKYTVVPGSKAASENKGSSGKDTGTNDDKTKETPKQVTFGPITLDGNLGDWTNLNKTVIEDPKGDSVGTKADVTTIYVARDSQYLYLAARITTNASINTKLDYNGDGNADFGANASSQNKEIYFFSFAKENEVTELGRSENIACQGNIIEFVIPLSAIGNPKSTIAIHIWSDMPDDKLGEADEVEGYYEVAEIGK